MGSNPEQLDQYWDALVAGDDELAHQILSDFDQNAEEQQTSEIVDVLQKLNQTRKNMSRWRPPQKIRDRGATIGDYEIVDVIGSGGMGVVYRAVQPGLNRTVAVKTIRNDEWISPKTMQRFREEASMIARLQHPNIVAVHEIGEDEGTLYYSMVFIEGDSLADRIDGQPLDPSEAARILIAVADAIEFAHSKKILHRDVKPFNILLDQSGCPFVTDFGLARTYDLDPADHCSSTDRLTQTGTILGTPSYLSPEQATGNSGGQTAATDAYGLGSTLYEMLSGRPPFNSNSVWETLHQIHEAQPVAPRSLNPEVPVDLNTICLKCLEKDPQQRYPTAQALKEDLQRFLNGETILAKPASRWTRFRRWSHREPRLVWSLAIASGLGISLLFATLFYAFHLNRAYQQTKLAEHRATRSSQVARTQRDHAMNTLNQLVFQIHAELEKDPGNLNARRQLLQVAVEGFEELIDEQRWNGQDDVPAHAFIMARIQLADVLVLLGQEEQARSYYRDAIEASRQALQSSPDPQIQADGARAHYRLGVMEASLDHIPTAQSHVHSALTTLQQLKTPRHGDADQLVHYLHVHFTLGWITEKAGDFVAAIREYRALSDELDRIYSGRSMPESIQWLWCNLYARLTHCCNEQFDLAEAAVHYDQFLRYFNQMNWNVEDISTDPIRSPAWALRDVSKYLLRQQRIDEAAEFAHRARNAAERLMEIHPDNVQVAIDVAMNHVHWALVQRARNDLKRADEGLARAISTIESAPKFHQSLRAQSYLTYPYICRMEIAQRRFDYEVAAQLCRRAMTIMQELKEEGNLVQPELISALPQTRRLLKAYQLLPEMIEDFRRATQHSAPMAAVLLIYCSNHFEQMKDYDQLLAAGDALMNLKLEDQLQYAIHMFDLARAYARAAEKLPADSSTRRELILRTFMALKRSARLDPDRFSRQLEVEPDIAYLHNEVGYDELISVYRQNRKSPTSLETNDSK